ncbi:MAG: hypothetical protein KOO63_00865 [Bacteroidales bacterium]|nr:hypothetical protein [Candidatus Latescibacterota bacterium]
MSAFFNAVAGKTITMMCMIIVLGAGRIERTFESISSIQGGTIVVAVDTEGSESEESSADAKKDSVSVTDKDSTTVVKSKTGRIKYRDRKPGDRDKPVKISISDRGVRVGSEDGEEVYFQLNTEELSENIEDALGDVDIDLGDLGDIFGLAGADDREFRTVHNNQVVRFGKIIIIDKDELVRGDVVSFFGDVKIDGKVTGDVVSIMGSIDIGPSAIINGEVVSVLGSLTEDDHARVRGQTVVIGDSPQIIGLPFHTDFGGGVFRLVSKLISFVVGTLLLLLIIYFLPDRIRKSSDFVFGSFFKSLGVGLLALTFGSIVVAIVAVILSITIIGIPVAILLGLSFGAMIIMGYFVSAMATGRILAKKVGVESDSLFVQGVLGLFVLSFLGILSSMMWIGPVVFASALVRLLGGFVTLVAVFTGTGSFILSKAGLLDNKSLPEFPDEAE